MENQKKRVCVLTSGGMDSALMLSVLKDQGFDVLPCYMDYGQKVKVRELPSLHAFCERYGFPRPVVFKVPMDDVFQDFWPVKGDSIPRHTDAVEKEYIPARNILFITKTAAFMQLNGILHMALGANNTDCMPDNNRGFFDEMEGLLTRGMGGVATPGRLAAFKVAGVEFRPRILTPIAELRKQDIARTYAEKKIDARLTWSCYDFKEKHCGVCWQCYERHEAFELAGLEDPTEYLEPVQLRPRR